MNPTSMLADVVPGWPSEDVLGSIDREATGGRGRILMNRKVTAFIANEILRPPLIAIGLVFRGLYMAKAQDRLSREIRAQFSSLFDDHNARIIPNENLGHLASLGWPIVTAAAEGLLFRFIPWRDTRQVHVASELMPNDWHELGCSTQCRR